MYSTGWRRVDPCMTSDVVYNKVSTIERCIKRVYEEYADSPASLHNITKQDSIILNIQPACETSIDLAMHITAVEKLGLPQSSRDAFELLSGHGVITEDISKKMKAMVGFRNIAIHDYQELNMEIVQHIITRNMSEIKTFSEQIAAFKH
ncbi:Uncharacterized conserved protein YutE, UPF0331/DUF86 family [Salibacterium qingdaonense]|uniref:Uncharacterized conserved protein YutE, UPF0331/DUF86 family n=2 Tax=Salibacterium qingdaonense TaxID=266892 RepID=A0A1I4LBZ8_9BACI|nr:Uncharacterized conserved protein YutE, UPF0331/DUF86 family [Salibacterium qingdaonense]